MLEPPPRFCASLEPRLTSQKARVTPPPLTHASFTLTAFWHPPRRSTVLHLPLLQARLLAKAVQRSGAAGIPCTAGQLEVDSRFELTEPIKPGTRGDSRIRKTRTHSLDSKTQKSTLDTQRRRRFIYPTTESPTIVPDYVAIPPLIHSPEREIPLAGFSGATGTGTSKAPRPNDT